MRLGLTRAVTLSIAPALDLVPPLAVVEEALVPREGGRGVDARAAVLRPAEVHGGACEAQLGDVHLVRLGEACARGRCCDLGEAKFIREDVGAKGVFLRCVWDACEHLA